MEVFRSFILYWVQVCGKGLTWLIKCPMAPGDSGNTPPGEGNNVGTNEFGDARIIDPNSAKSENGDMECARLRFVSLAEFLGLIPKLNDMLSGNAGDRELGGAGGSKSGMLPLIELRPEKVGTGRGGGGGFL